MELWWLLCELSLFAAASAIYPSVLTEYGVVTGVQDGNVMVGLGLEKFFERTRLLQLPLLTFFFFFRRPFTASRLPARRSETFDFIHRSPQLHGPAPETAPKTATST
jgi:hypothetical protein